MRGAMLPKLMILASGTSFCLLDSMQGTPEILTFESREAAAAEKHSRVVQRGYRLFAEDPKYSEIQDALYKAVKTKFGRQEHCDLWVRDFDSDTVYFFREGQNYSATYEYKAGIIELGTPTPVRIRTVYEPIEFTQDGVTFSDDGKTVVYEGKIWEAGFYPDKHPEPFEERDVESMVSNFEPCFNDLEHEDTILDEKLGKLEKVWHKGKELFGRVTVPKWLFDEVGGIIKCSIALSRDKRIVGNALCINPRIKDAAIMAAFSRSEAVTGKKTKMKIKDILAAMGFGGVSSLDDDVPTVNFSHNPQPNADDTETARMKAELAGFREAEKTRKGAAIETLVIAFADKAVADKKRLPADHESLKTVFRAALVGDGEAGEIRFGSAGEVIEGAGAKALRELIEKSPVIDPNNPAPASAAEAIAFAGAPGAGDEEKIAKETEAVLKATGAGRAALDKAAK